MEPMIDRIGGEEKVHHLVDHFYDLIETLPQGRAIMEMHLKGHGLPMSAPRSSSFFAASSAGGAITTNATAT
jgi:hemoglobin